MKTETIDGVLHYVWRPGDELPGYQPINVEYDSPLLKEWIKTETPISLWGDCGLARRWPKLLNDRAQHERMIKEEYEHAVKKHPKFCDIVTDRGIATVQDNLDNCREILNLSGRHGKEEACRVLQEECLEVEEAYLEGRLHDCLHELAQCGAVVKRMMEYVQCEIDKEGAE